MSAIRFFHFYSILFLGIFFISSCVDKPETPNLEKPVLAVTPTLSTVGAGDRFPFSVDASGVNKLTKFSVEENYGGAKRMILDSTFNPSKPGLSFAYNYHVPDTASKGQEITLVFALTDEKGNVTTDTEKFNVSYSKPTIVLTADKEEANQGDTVHFTAKITSALPNLKQLEITESINGTLGTVIKTHNYPANTANDTYTYSYVVPNTVSAGKYLVITFKAINDEGVSASGTHRIDVK